MAIYSNSNYQNNKNNLCYNEVNDPPNKTLVSSYSPKTFTLSCLKNYTLVLVC